MEHHVCYVCYNEETEDNTFLQETVCNCSQTYKIHSKCFALLQNKHSCSICKSIYKGLDKMDIRSNGLRLIVELDQLGFRHEYTVDEENVKQGLHTIWYHNGNIWEQNYYKNGLREGFQKLYTVTGEIYREIEYKNGNRV